MWNVWSEMNWGKGKSYFIASLKMLLMDTLKILEKRDYFIIAFIILKISFLKKYFLYIVLYCNYLDKVKQSEYVFISNNQSNPRKHRFELYCIEWLLKIFIYFKKKCVEWKVFTCCVITFPGIRSRFCFVFGAFISFVNKDNSS